MAEDPFKKFIDQLDVEKLDNPNQMHTFADDFLDEREIGILDRNLEKNPDLFNNLIGPNRSFVVIMEVNEHRFHYVNSDGIPMSGSLENLRKVTQDPNFEIKEGELFEFETNSMRLSKVTRLDELTVDQKRALITKIQTNYLKRDLETNDGSK